jgi:hypothetical protein
MSSTLSFLETIKKCRRSSRKNSRALVRVHAVREVIAEEVAKAHVEEGLETMA